MKDSTHNSKNSKATSILTSISMLTSLPHLTLPSVYSNLNSSCSMMQEIIQIIKEDTKVTITSHTLCITQETIMSSQIIIISSKHQYSRILLNINLCSSNLVLQTEVETVDIKKGEEEVVTINSEH